MQLLQALAVASAVMLPASAQRPKDEPICDYYTKALLKENSAENQMKLLTLVVNTVVIGNYTMPNVGVKVDGILAPGKYMDKDVNLMPYFDGTLKSSNRGGDMGVSVNFLDDGGAEPLKKNMPANGKDSMQYFLLTHLYQFFGSLLGCSMQGMPGFDAYDGHASMYEVHKFMDLDAAEVGYFISQVGMAAASFGVADEDVTAVGESLTKLFDVRCAPPATAIKSQGPQLQSICIAEDCPLAPDAVCGKYDKAMEPMSMSGSMSMSMSMSAPYPTGTASSMMPTGTGAMAMPSSSMMPTGSMVPTAGAGRYELSLAAAAGGLAAFLL